MEELTSKAFLGVDVGGTFTDAALVVDGRLYASKTPTTPNDQSEGVLSAIQDVLKQANCSPHTVKSFAHGTTTATNALIEGQVARTLFVATKGFSDIIELGRQNRADLYRLCAAHPAPLSPPELRIEVDERMAPTGVVKELTADSVATLIAQVGKLKPEAIAICLLHSYRFPEHEQRLSDSLKDSFPGIHISLSHEIVGTFREFERAATTEIDAALSPLLARYLNRLNERTSQLQLCQPVVMQSSGGLTTIERAGMHGSLTVLSGPAGGAAGAAWSSLSSGEADALCFDMGGTSCDISVIRSGRVRETTSGTVAGRPIALPMLDIQTVGAGGGSIAWRDAGGALRVGPQSAGASPGPAAYGQGGREPTVTDANVVLGYLSSDTVFANTIQLRRDLAEEAVNRLAVKLGVTTIQCAEGIRRVANAEMLRALRVMTVQRGINPREMVLLAFGGAGGLHAADIAQELKMKSVLFPAASGVLAALGLIVGEQRADAQKTVLLSGDSFTTTTVRKHIETLADSARKTLTHPTAKIGVTCDLRYKGQSFELAVNTNEYPTVHQLKKSFSNAHEEAYGYRDPEGVIELVTIRVHAVKSDRSSVNFNHDLSNESPAKFTRSAIFGGEQHRTTIVQGPPKVGDRFSGPTIIELPHSTLLIPPEWNAYVDKTGAVRLEVTQ